MTYTPENTLNADELVENIYFAMFTFDHIYLSEEYRIYVTFAHYYTKCLTGGHDLWED
jgi:hypothetical protein